jgi:hypothetical protein
MATGAWKEGVSPPVALDIRLAPESPDATGVASS